MLKMCFRLNFLNNFVQRFENCKNGLNLPQTNAPNNYTYFSDVDSSAERLRPLHFGLNGSQISAGLTPHFSPRLREAPISFFSQPSIAKLPETPISFFSPPIQPVRPLLRQPFQTAADRIQFFQSPSQSNFVAQKRRSTSSNSSSTSGANSKSEIPLPFELIAPTVRPRQYFASEARENFAPSTSADDMEIYVLSCGFGPMQAERFGILIEKSNNVTTISKKKETHF